MSDRGQPDPSVVREFVEMLEKRLKNRAVARDVRRTFEEGAEEGEARSDGASRARCGELLRGLSLLWPSSDASRPSSPPSTVPEQTATDLEIPYLVTQIAPKRKYAPLLDQILRAPLTDEDTIRYRQEIVADILECRELRLCVRLLAEQVVATSESLRFVYEDRPRLFMVALQLAELQDFVDAVDALTGAMASAASLRSRGLRLLRERLGEIAAAGWYVSLRSTVARLLSDIRDIRSVTVGINLDNWLRPVEATLLSINRHPFRGSTLLDTILGRTGEESRRGIADLHSMLAQRAGMALPVAPPLFRDLASILDQLGRGMERELAVFSSPAVDFVTALKQELVFYASAVSLVERLGGAGLPVCVPAMASRDERVTELRDAYNVNLAFRLLERSENPSVAIVRNDALLEHPLRIAVLTGPNNGGKSVFLQAVGLAQLLAQTGMHAPAKSALLSVTDAIVTHYQANERPDKEVGRLHEEAERLRDSLAAVSRYSLLLSSETFSSTGSTEAAYLLHDVLRALCTLGVRAKPRGKSYAQAIARKLGIQYDQIVESLERAGRLPPGGRGNG